MSKIDALIQKLCPDGVEYKHLWQLTTWDKRFNAVDNKKQPKVIKYHYLLASELKPLIAEDGDIKLLTTNTSNLWTKEELAGDKISIGEVVAIPWGGNPNVQYFKGKFLTADNRIATSNDTEVLNNKFLYYFLLNRIELIGTFYRGSGIKHPSMAKVLDLKVPVPPIELQQEIVDILDKFTQLEAELEARKKQYEYYRNQLLTFEDAGGYDGQPWEKLCRLVEVLRQDQSALLSQLALMVLAGLRLAMSKRVQSLLPKRPRKSRPRVQKSLGC